MKPFPHLRRLAIRHCLRSSFVAMALAVLSIIGRARDASAQSVCGPGQAVVDSVGHCCSPGQTWNTSVGECVSASTVAPQEAPAILATVQVNGPGTMIVAAAPVTPRPSTDLVAVTFAPERASDTITLHIQTVTGATLACNVPCVVNVPPGYISIAGSGSRNFESGLDVPDWPITVLVNHYDPPVGAYVAGGILTGLGVAGSAASIVLMTNQTHCVPASSSAALSAFESCRSANDTHEMFGAIGLVTSITALIVGPVILGSAAGHRRHPLTRMSPGELLHRPMSTRGPDVHLTGLAWAPIPGGAIAGASVSF